MRGVVLWHEGPIVESEGYKAYLGSVIKSYKDKPFCLEGTTIIN